MENEHIEIIRRHIVHYGCGCTTTRIEVQHTNLASLGVCTGHDLSITKEEQITEFHKLNGESERSQPS